MSEDGEVIIERLSAPWRDRRRSYKVVVDKNSAGTISAGETRSIRLSAGAHVVQLKVDWLGSAALPVTVVPGQAVRLQAEPAGSSWTAIVDLLLKRRPYITLRQVSA